MSNADRIEELRKKYEENPRRYFAPLANEFRKAGDLGQAIAICREHLPKQPGHMSGYIVFGQTLFEANSLDEARTVFEQALTLDPENLIALKHLGDIARMNGENSIARRWYARVLDADPRNDDIASQLASLGAPTPAIPVPVIPPPAPEPERVFEPVPELDDKPGVFATFDPSTVSAPQSGLPDLDDLSFAPADPVASQASEPAAARSSQPEAPATSSPTPAYDARLEPLDLDFPENPEPASEEFEEGILAPEWPDTSELVARMQTPVRSSTPLSVPSVPASAEAVQAFGRESGDPVDALPVDVPVADGLVDAFLPVDHVAPSAPESSFVAELSAGEFEPAEFDASAVEPHEFDSPLAEVEHEIPVTAQIESESLLDLNETPMPWDLPKTHATPGESSAAAVREEAAVPGVAEASQPAEEFSAAEPVEFSAGHAGEPAADEVELPSFELSAESVDDVPSGEELPRDEIMSSGHYSADADAGDVANADDVTTQVTAEFAIPGDWSVTPEASDPLVAEALDMVGEPWEAAEVLDEPAVPQVHTFDADLDLPAAESPAAELPAAELPVVELPDEVVPLEESFAGVSSEIESEREANEVAVEAAAHETETPTFVTETMAELLLSQGHTSRAIEVYDELVRRRPHDPVLVSRLDELRATERAESERSESLRAELLRAESERVAQQAAQAAMPTPALSSNAVSPQSVTPLYSTPLRATPVFTPQHASNSGAFSAQASAQQTFRTARERFAELASRRVARRTPTHATAIAEDQADGLSTLFGTAQPTTTDELAARALADAFGPVQDSGESLFDPAPMPTPAVPLRALTPRSVTPVSSPAHAGQEQRSQPATDYSFDKFFPDPAMTSRDAHAAHSSAVAAEDPSQPVNEDLAQFSAWLKGLNNA